MKPTYFKYALVTAILVVSAGLFTSLNAQSTVISSVAGAEIPGDENVYTVYIPNSFTPNADGINDEFMVFSEQLKRVNIKIYDQMGQEVYNTSEIGKGWNGKNLRQKDMHQDTYLYRIEAEYTNGGSEILVGPVCLIR